MIFSYQLAKEKILSAAASQALLTLTDEAHTDMLELSDYVVNRRGGGQSFDLDAFASALYDAILEEELRLADE